MLDTITDPTEQARDLVLRLSPWDGTPYAQNECDTVIYDYRRGAIGSVDALDKFITGLKHGILNSVLPVDEVVPEAFSPDELDAAAHGVWPDDIAERIDRAFPGVHQ